MLARYIHLIGPFTICASYGWCRLLNGIDSTSTVVLQLGLNACIFKFFITKKNRT